MSARYNPTSTTLPISALAKKLIKHERSGRYEDGLAMFGERFGDSDFLPDTEGLTAEEASIVFLRFGSLLGFFAFKHRVNGGLDRSKDILTGARQRFIDLQNIAGVAECETHIALGYWRRGELQEAKVWIEESLSHDLPDSHDSRLSAHLIKSLIFLSLKLYRENISNCLAVESHFREYGDAYLNGSLCTNIGLSFKNCGQNAEAMRYLVQARFFHEKSRHRIYLASVHNNLAQLYKTERRFGEAHESVDMAIKLYKQLKDGTRGAASIDTKAQICFAEKRLADGLAAADKSIAMLRKSDSAVCLAESLLTRSKILLYSDRFADAVLSLVDAVNLTRVQNSEEAARGLIEEFETAIRERNEPVATPQAIEKNELELVLPPSIGNYSEYKGVWINSSHLEKSGIKQGSLAIVAPEVVKRGDLVAITENDSEQVICGVYDSEFGIVCLERDDDDPQLFNENDIRILGKIIGVCNTGRDADGKMIVEPINR